MTGGRAAAPSRWVVPAGRHRLVLGQRTLVMGVINATPDSFSGDGLGGDVSRAVDLAESMVAAGADLLDVGGESTRPNATPVAEAEELQRVLPVVAAVAERVAVPVSIDTRHAAVAAAAIDAGATMVNDIWGLRGDPAMAAVVAAGDAAVIAMHNHRGTGYDNLMIQVREALAASLAIAAGAGISPDRVILDPGFGFGKTPAQNVEVVRRLGELLGIGRPVLVGVSRKSTVGALLGGAPPDQRLEGGIALAVLAVAAGAAMVRVHDVGPTVRALRVADAVIHSTPPEVEALPAPGPTG